MEKKNFIPIKYIILPIILIKFLLLPLLLQAYKKHRASSVEITRIISFTLVACSFILGCFILASSYVESQANMCVQQVSHEFELRNVQLWIIK